MTVTKLAMELAETCRDLCVDESRTFTVNQPVNSEDSRTLDYALSVLSEYLIAVVNGPKITITRLQGKPQPDYHLVE